MLLPLEAYPQQAKPGSSEFSVAAEINDIKPRSHFLLPTPGLSSLNYFLLLLQNRIVIKPRQGGGGRPVSPTNSAVLNLVRHDCQVFRTSQETP